MRKRRRCRLSSQKLALVALSLVTLILSVTVHEFAHAFAASKLGDDLPEREGRLTLSPLAHIDPIGTLLVPTIGLLAGGFLFGWGRSVTTQPTQFTRRFSMRGGQAIVSFAGPFANLILATLCVALFVGLSTRGVLGDEGAMGVLLLNLAQLNVVLFILNMLPVPPLDGSKIFAWLFGQRVDRALDSIASMGPMMFFLILILAGGGISWASGVLLGGLFQGFSRVLGA